MPEEITSSPSSISQPLGKHSRNWKKISLILLIIGFSVSLVGVGIYFIGTGEVQAPSSQKQATPSSKKSKQIPLVFAFSRNIDKKQWEYARTILAKELWIYKNGDIERVTTDVSIVKYQLSSDTETLYYLKREVIQSNSTDYLVGEVVKKNTNNNVEVIIIPKIKLDKNVLKGEVRDFDISHDEKKIVFTQDGLWVLDLTTSKISKIATSSYYDLEKGLGHSYGSVQWSPSDKYIASGWGGYERFGYELINIGTKKITSIEPGGFPPEYDFSEFISDSEGVFVNTTYGGQARIISKSFKDLKNNVIFEGFGEGPSEFYLSDLTDLKYVPLQDRFYMIQKNTTSNEPEGTGSFFRSKIVYLDRKTGKMFDLTKEFGKDIVVSNLSVAHNGNYTLFNVGDDIWVHTKENGSRMLVENAFNPVLPKSK